MNQGPEEKRSWAELSRNLGKEVAGFPAFFSVGEGASIKFLGLTLPQDYQETEVRVATTLPRSQR